MLTPIKKESFCEHNPMEPNKILNCLFESLRSVIFRDVRHDLQVTTLRGIYRPICDTWPLITGSFRA